MHLYEINEQYRNSLAQFEENPDSEILKQQLTGITEDFTVKAENIGKMVKELEAETVAIKTEVDRLAARKKATENKIKWLETYLFENMVSSGQDKISGQIITLSLRKALVSVVVVDQTLIPGEFIRIIPEIREPNKILLVDDFKKTGVMQPGCEYITDKKTLQIR
jgi:hypothetical protein